MPQQFDLAHNIVKIEQRLQELKSIGNPGNYGTGNVLFGASAGNATTDSNFIWDNTNKRLGIGIAAPLATLSVKGSGGSNILQRIELINASGDTMLDLFNSDSTIGSGSNFLIARTTVGSYFQLRGDGYYLQSFRDTGTNNAPSIWQIGHNTSGVPVANFGLQFDYLLDTNGASNRAAYSTIVNWQNATDGSRRSQIRLFAYDNGGSREVIRFEANAAPMLSFFGVAAVVRQTVGAAAPAGGVGTAAGGYDTAANRNAMITLVNNMRQAGINLGLWQT